MNPSPRTAASYARRPLLVAALGLSACNFEVPSSSYLMQTRLLAVLAEVAELGPLNPDRVGVPSAAPIAEAMPHDTLRFEAFVVDRNGERIPSEALDSLWFQCGVFDCGENELPVQSPLFDVDCSELEELHDTDSVCRLGRGDGEFEFVVPELGQLMTNYRIGAYYGVIAWEGRSAESCWAGRRSGTESLENCGFIRRLVKIGPSWWMLAYAEANHLISPIPIPEIPAGVYLQAANRVPEPTFLVMIDGELRGAWPEQTSFEVQPGARISIESQYDELAQFLQTYFLAAPVNRHTERWLYQAASETLGELPYSSNAIAWLEDELPAELGPPVRWQFAVDQHAEPGRSRILFVYFDDRFGEGVATLDFEVQPQ